MQQPLISVITPTYNHENYIDACIRSILRQNYKNWEQIIVDDCSTDRTCSIIKGYIKSDKRIKLIKNIKRLGLKNLSVNYNKALSASRGSLIAILEGDDYLPNNKLEIQHKSFMQDSSVVMSYGDWVMMTEKGLPIHLRTHGFHNIIQNVPIGDIARRYATLRFDICSPTVMIKKDVLLSVGGFQASSLYPFVDIPTYLALSMKGKFIYHKEILGYYRRAIHSGWYDFASQQPEMGRREVASLANFYLNKAQMAIPSNQQNELERRRSAKKLSIFKNEVLYKNNLINSVIVRMAYIFFIIRLIIYKLEKFLYLKNSRK